MSARLLYAQLKESACLEDLDFRDSRNLKRAAIDQLATGDWLRYHQNVLVTGPTGTGKTYLACALAHAACRAGYRAVYCYGPGLFRDLTLPMPMARRQTAQASRKADCWCSTTGASELDHQGYRDFSKSR